MSLNKLFFLALYFTTTVFAASDAGIKVPLHFYPLYGIYTATVKIGNNPVQSVEAIIDTGSSSMVFTTNEKYCPSCSKALTKGALNPEKMSASQLSKAIDLSYGSASDTALEYIAPVQYSDNEKNSLMMNIFLLKDSDQPTSIIGMIHHNLREKQVNYTPFLVKVTENFNKYAELSFLMCADRGKSYYYIGPWKFPGQAYTSKMLESNFYEINTSGFYDQENKPVAKTTDAFNGAILDTGTGGFIIVTPHLYQPLHDYIYKNSGEKNQKIDPNFWQNNYCIDQKAIDFNAFPTLKIGFQNIDSQSSYYLTLPPTTYLNKGGCGEGYVRLVFTKGLPPVHPTAVRNHLLRVASGATPAMIIGTSLLNHYAMSIHYKNNPRIEFYDNKELCRP